MDDFDLLNQPAQQGGENTTTQNNDLFESENTNSRQQEDLSWEIENVGKGVGEK